MPGKSHGWRSLEGCSPWGLEESDRTERLHFHALEKEMATHSSVLAWRIPGTGEPSGLPSMGSHRIIVETGRALLSLIFSTWFFFNLNGIFLSQHVFKRPARGMAMAVVNSLLLIKCTSTEISIIGTPHQLEVCYLKKKKVKEKVWEDKFSKQFSYRRVSDSVSVQSQIKFWDTGCHSSVGY